MTVDDFAAMLAIELARRELAICEVYPGREYNEWHEVQAASLVLAAAIRAFTKCPSCGKPVNDPVYGPGSNEYHAKCE